MKEILSQIKIFYEDAFRRLNQNGEPPEIKVSFYPYLDIQNKIRGRKGKVSVRIAQILEDAPAEIQKSLALILVGKILGKRIPKADSEKYYAFIKTDTMRARAVENRRRRGRKIVTTAKGEFYDLEEIFDRLNRIYFQNQLPKPVLTWSAQKTFRHLGHHDSIHKTLVVSKSLDDKKVPAYVVEYLVYHEMLHIKHPTIHRNGRRYNHTPAFRRDEENFKYFDAAEEWIKQNVGALKRKIKTQRRRNRLR